MKKIMILGASILQLPAILKAKEMGLYVIVLDMDPKAIGFEYADEFYIISTIDTEKVLDLARKINLHGIMTLASDKPMLTVAKVGETLGLNTISTETSIKVTNKARMREVLSLNNVPIPKFKVVNTKEEYLNHIEKFNNKFIVKPADSSGSRGIFLVEKESQVIEAYEHSKQYSSTGEVLIEEYLEGPEVSVESITVDGETKIIAITDKDTTGAPHFVELGHSIPSRLNENIRRKIEKVTISAINSLGINVGPSHTEIKVTSDGPKIIEVGARLGGDNITTHLVPLATGINMVESSIKMALGMNIEYKFNELKGASIRYFHSKPGILSEVSNLEYIKKIDGVEEVILNKNIGDRISKLRSSNDRLGYIISSAYTVEDAIKICEHAKKELNIKIR